MGHEPGPVRSFVHTTGVCWQLSCLDCTSKGLWFCFAHEIMQMRVHLTHKLVRRRLATGATCSSSSLRYQLLYSYASSASNCRTQTPSAPLSLPSSSLSRFLQMLLKYLSDYESLSTTAEELGYSKICPNLVEPDSNVCFKLMSQWCPKEDSNFQPTV